MKILKNNTSIIALISLTIIYNFIFMLNTYATDKIPIIDYRFETCEGATTTNDYSGNGLDGELIEGAVIIKDNGIIGNSLYLDGSNDGQYLKTLDDPLLQIVDDLTISLWINPDELRNGGLVVKNHKKEYWFAINTNGTLRFGHGDGNYTIIDSDISVNPNEWSHVTVTRDSINKKLKFYINGGEKFSEKDYTNSIIYGNDFLTSGSCDSCGYPFKGYLDEIKIFDSTLSYSEINDIYNNEKNGKNFDGTNRCSKASIGNFIWFDSNKNGIQDSGENGIEGVNIELYNKNDVLEKTTTTSSSGAYNFDNLSPNDYYLKIIAPLGYNISPQNIGSDDLIDSDIDTINGKTQIISLSDNENDLSWDAGLFIYECPFVIKTDSTIINFNSESLYSTTGNTHEVEYSFPTTLEKGDYRISLAASDGYTNREKTTSQANEKYKIIFDNGQESNSTEDLEDGVVFAYWEGVVNENFTLTSSSDKIKIRHSAYIDDSSANSIVPTCMLIEKIIEKDNCPEGDYSSSEYDGTCGTKPDSKDNCPNGDYSSSQYDGTCGTTPKDNCPNGDYSSSQYDGTCGTKPKDNCPEGDYSSSQYDGTCGTTPKDNCPEGDYSSSQYDGTCGTKPKDNCPEGDYSSSQYDGTCGTKPKDNCPNGDYTSSEYDNRCGLKPKDNCPEGDYTSSNYDNKCGEKPVEDLDYLYNSLLKKYLIHKKNVSNLIDILLEERKTGKGLEKFPNILPKTGTPISDRIKKIYNSSVDIELPKNISVLAGNDNEDINFWKKNLNPLDKNKDEYLVLPSNGLVVPINKVEKTTSDYNKLVSGQEIEVNKYLKDGVLSYPGTSKNNYGEIGNKVIFGHSSYWKNDDGRYKTHFQKIIELDENEEVWIYKKQFSGEYKRFKYLVTKSYDTHKTDIGILKPGVGKNLTLLTCTPIGGIEGRWIIKAKYIDDEKEKLINEIYGNYIDNKFKNGIDKFILSLSKISDYEKKKFIILKIYQKTKPIEEKNKSSVIRDRFKYLNLRLAIELFKKT